MYNIYLLNIYPLLTIFIEGVPMANVVNCDIVISESVLQSNPCGKYEAH